MRKTIERYGLLILCSLFTILTHLGSFNRSHHQGDERVFLSLARNMNWGTTRYTTQNDPEVANYPAKMYQSKFFIHPPLFPLLLKVGYSLDMPVKFGLFIQLLFMLIVLFATNRFSLFYKWDTDVRVFTMLLMSFCPYLMYSTTRLHLDGLFAISAFCSFLYLSMAVQKALNKFINIGCFFWFLALSFKFTGIITLIPNGMLMWFIYKRSYKGLGVMTFSLGLGALHFLRFMMVNKTLLPFDFLVSETSAMNWNNYMADVYSRDRFDVFKILLMISPGLLMILNPSYVRFVFSKIKRASVESLCFVTLFFYLTCMMIFNFHQLRFFVLISPFLILQMAYSFRYLKKKYPDTYYLIVTFFAFFQVSTCIMCVMAFPLQPKIVPSLVRMIPYLARNYF